MSKYIKTIPLERLRRMEIYLNPKGLTLEQVMELPTWDRPPDFGINGGYYEGDWTPAAHLKVNGKVLSVPKPSYDDWGFAWDTGKDIKMVQIPRSGITLYRNHISCKALLTPWDGPDAALDVPAHLKGSRGWQAMALTGTSIITHSTSDGKDGMTLHKLRDAMYKLGGETVLALDSGKSVQAREGDGSVYIINPARPVVQNYILFWLEPEEKEEKPMGKTVVLDAGHGAGTAGKRSPDGTYLEHEFALDMAKRCKALLERHGVSVTMTRTDEHDVSLAKRVQIANGIQGLDLFVSLHSNAQKGTGWLPVRGYGIYTSVAGATAARNIAANKLLARAKEAGVGLWGNGLHHDKTLYVLKNTVAPAILIEHGFHTNKAETTLLKDPAYRQKLAEVDAKGILDYLGIPWVEDKPQEPEKPTMETVCPHCGGGLKIEKG